MSGLAQRWHDVLETIERDVATVQAAIGRSEAIVPRTWSPPVGLGPVPAELRPRATELLARIEDVATRCQDDLAELSAELGQVDRRRDAGNAYAASGSIGTVDGTA